MPKSTTSRVFLETVGGVVIARFADPELVAEEVIQEVSDQLIALVEGAGPTDVLLNFGQVRIMSSSMLGVLLKFSRLTTKLGGRVKLCAIAPQLLEVFRITRFDRLFEIHTEEAAALDSF